MRYRALKLEGAARSKLWRNEGWIGGGPGGMDRTTWRDSPGNLAPASTALSNVLCLTEIKCTVTGRLSNLSLIVLVTAWLSYWFLSIVNAKKIRHHKTKARFLKPNINHTFHVCVFPRRQHSFYPRYWSFPRHRRVNYAEIICPRSHGY